MVEAKMAWWTLTRAGRASPLRYANGHLQLGHDGYSEYHSDNPPSLSTAQVGLVYVPFNDLQSVDASVHGHRHHKRKRKNSAGSAGAETPPADITASDYDVNNDHDDDSVVWPTPGYVS
jgi:hypothetical protein